MQQLIIGVVLFGLFLAALGVATMMSGAQVFDHESDRRKADDWEEGE